MTNEELKNMLFIIDTLLDDAITDSTRQKVKDKLTEVCQLAMKALEQQTMGHCKDCRWWKDSDGAYRRDVGAESQCPINCQEVYKGNGYCFMYVPQESEDKE